ncbi:hypothetical protein cypCar_00046713 [Cyprinus carpio]|nr:hypothetical protein cypCar_00046713 [Cyprinus carpio]
MRVQLEVDASDYISVCEVKDLQLEMNRNDGISELKSPTLVSEDLSDPAGPSVEEANDQGGLDAENSPTESTKAMKSKKVHGFVVTKRVEYATVRNIKKTSTFLQKDRPKPVGVSAWPEMDLNVPEPEPREDLAAPHRLKWDLVDAVELYTPGPSVPEEDLDEPPECEWDMVDSMELYAPGSSDPEPDSVEDLFDSLELYVPGPSVLEPQPEWDLATPEDLGAPGPSILEPESKVLSELSSLENYVPLNIFQLEDRLKQCTLFKQRHVTNVWPRVFIGDEETATDRDMLQEMCITHILNAAAPKKDLNYFLGTSYVEDIVGTVNTGSRYYRGLHINYYSLPTMDRHCSDISKCFMPAAKFIDKALDKRASKVLICCKQGVDHSATLFLAYLMICHDMMVEDAIDHVIKSRRIRPSRDFLKKLMLLNADLVNKRKLKLEDIKAGRERKKWQLKKSSVQILKNLHI